jgi:hypothetical protein
VLEGRQVIRIETRSRMSAASTIRPAIEQMSVGSRRFGAQVMEDGISWLVQQQLDQDADLGPTDQRVEV